MRNWRERRITICSCSRPFAQWFPGQIASVNRFLTFDRQLQQRLVVVPGQFRAATNAAATRGTQRLYSSLKLEVLTAPESSVDFTAPRIGEVNAAFTPAGLRFSIRVGDDSGKIGRVVVLYAAANSTSWTPLELVYNPDTGFAEQTTSVPPGLVRYMVQAADAAGNVALALDHNNPYELRSPFPGNAALDAFGRADGSVGSNWEGLTATRFFRVAGGALDVQEGGALVWKSAFGKNQEAFVSFSTVDPLSRSQGVLLKVQTGSVLSAGAIAVVYDGKAKALRVSTMHVGAKAWTAYPSTATTFADGDQLGARALASGDVQIFKNGTLIGTVTLSAADKSFFNSKGGKIGVWMIGAPGAVLDNFGGGNIMP